MCKIVSKEVCPIANKNNERRELVLKMSNILLSLTAILAFMTINETPTPVNAAPSTYTVIKGDTLWKISVRYEIPLDQVIKANPQIKNPHWIYPNQVINIPAEPKQITEAKGIEEQVLALVNQERKKAGVAPLQMDWELQRVARVKSCDMRDNNYFSHDSPEYGTPFEMMKDFGIKYKTAGENIASGQKTAQQVMNSWLNSAGHRKNILSGSFTHIGVGYCEGGSMSPYWTQQFIGK